MEFRHGQLSVDGIPERSAIGFLIGVEAPFAISDRGLIILDEPIFPVLELALSLSRWVVSGKFREFAFDSLDYEEIGVVSITSSASGGWIVSSCFTPDVHSAPCKREDLFAAICEFSNSLYFDLRQIDSDAALILEPELRALKSAHP